MRRNPALAGDVEFADFDLSDPRGWEGLIRAHGGLKIARQDRGDFANLPGYLKGYRRGIAPDELVDAVARARGVAHSDVERSWLDAFAPAQRQRARGQRGGLPPSLAGIIAPEEWATMSTDQRRSTLEFFESEAAAVAEVAPRARRPPGPAPAGAVVRPRVTVAGDTFTLGPRSPYKGTVVRVNPRLGRRRRGIL